MTAFQITTVETQIIRGTIDALLASGFTLGVNDGEETTLKRCREAATILAAMRTTDEDYLLVYKADGSGGEFGDGWVRFVYGNEDHEVINDYTTNLEEFLAPINAEIDKVFP